MSGGSFSISRAIWDHPDFTKSKFSEREAFIWMISEAAWKPHRKRAGRVVVDLERGQLCASIRFMGKAWGWSKSRVSRFLERIENRDMIETQSGTGQLVITLCNYDKFQLTPSDSGTRAGQKAGHERDTSGTNQNTTNKGNKEYIGDFDAFWSAVPRKVAKGAARKAYKSALKKADPETILSGIKSYAQSVKGRDDQYIAHPATWLNGERWSDEAEPTQPKKLTDEQKWRQSLYGYY